MSFWVEHGLHLALVAVPSSAMGTGMLVERRKGQQQRAAASSAVASPPVPTGSFGGGPLMTLPWLHEASRPRSSDPIARPATVAHPLALPAVAVASAGAALTHLVVMPEHFTESFLYGTFFLCAAILQMFWAVMVAYRPTRSALIAGAIGCAATIALWLFSRTVGIPAAVGGVDGGAPEAVGALDVLATSFEVVAVLGVVVALRATVLSGGSPARWPLTAKMIGLTALCVTAAVAFWAPVN